MDSIATDHSSPEQKLDAEISSIRAEIRNLQKRKRLLSSSLLSSEYIQKRVRQLKPTTTVSPQTTNLNEMSPLVESAGRHAESNHHRIAFGATAFPFKDPSPNSDANSNLNLLGVRIDISTRTGRFVKPYYMLLRREPGHDDERRLRVHRHTIPAFISMEKLERLYLPVPSTSRAPGNGEGAEQSEIDLKPWKYRNKTTRKQNVHALVRELRKELVAWHFRVDAVDMLREELGLSSDSSHGNGLSLLPEDAKSDRPLSSLGIVSLSSTSLEARYVRLEWKDGRVGRFKISNSGLVERAVVIGDHNGRDKALEDALTGGDGRVEGVLGRLRGVHV